MSDPLLSLITNTNTLVRKIDTTLGTVTKDIDTTINTMSDGFTRIIISIIIVLIIVFILLVIIMLLQLGKSIKNEYKKRI